MLELVFCVFGSTNNEFFFFFLPHNCSKYISTFVIGKQIGWKFPPFFFSPSFVGLLILAQLQSALLTIFTFRVDASGFPNLNMGPKGKK